MQEGGGGYIGDGIQDSRGRGCRGWVGGHGEGRVNIQPNVYRYTDSTAPPFHKKTSLPRIYPRLTGDDY